jgi:DNA-binding LytR/AlgR family response regulator
MQLIIYKKPFNYERFSIACKKALRVFASKQDTHQKELTYITIKSEYKMINLAVDRIMYIESKDDYVKIYLSDGKFIMSKITTKSMMDKLPSSVFIRIHRSYVVNIHFVRSISSTSLMIENKEFPIGKKFKEDVQQIMKGN